MMRSIVWVKWLDASYERGPLKEDEISTDCVMESCGFVVKLDKEFISLAQDFWEPDKTFRNITHIPRVNVVAMKKVGGR